MITPGYFLESKDQTIWLQVERLRRKNDQLLGEVSAGCILPGAKTTNGVLVTTDFNFNSQTAAKTLAKDLAERARTNGKFDWTAFIDEFRQCVHASERDGDPIVDLRNVPRPLPGRNYEIDGLVLPMDDPSIIFGDGGSAKSTIAGRTAGMLSEQGVVVGYFDWELSQGHHRENLERLFGENFPRVLYMRCDRPLTVEVDRICKAVHDHKIKYGIFDSIAFACDGPPEAAEVAGRYYRAHRQIGIGSLDIAHITKGENSDQRPFGSTFWHNGARSTWFVQAAEQSGDGKLHVGLYNRKANFGPLSTPVSYTIEFTSNRTIFSRSNIADNPDLSQKLTVRFRMKNLLLSGARTPSEIAEELDANSETINRTARRYPKEFVRHPDGLIGLYARQS